VSEATLSTPSRIDESHDRSGFDCGVLSLNDWLARRALGNERRGASRTYVVCENTQVVGYYSLTSGSVNRSEAPKPLQRNMPDQVPVILMGRFAIDQDYQGLGIGRELLRDAIFRVLSAAEIIGVRAILVDAISLRAKGWYVAQDFDESNFDAMKLYLPLERARHEITL